MLDRMLPLAAEDKKPEQGQSSITTTLRMSAEVKSPREHRDTAPESIDEDSKNDSISGISRSSAHILVCCQLVEHVQWRPMVSAVYPYMGRYNSSTACQAAIITGYRHSCRADGLHWDLDFKFYHDRNSHCNNSGTVQKIPAWRTGACKNEQHHVTNEGKFCLHRKITWVRTGLNPATWKQLPCPTPPPCTKPPGKQSSNYTVICVNICVRQEKRAGQNWPTL